MKIIVPIHSCLIVLLAWSQALAVDGEMGVVTGNPGKIMDGNKVLAEVPRGTRLWIFSEKPGWSEVKVPGKEQRGWLSTQAIEAVEYTAPESAKIDEAITHYDEFLKHYNAAKYAPALASLEKSHEILRSIKGADHPEVADALFNMGHIACAQEDYRKAVQHYRETLAIRRQALGTEHPETVAVLLELGSQADDQQDYPAAQKHFEETLAIRRKLLGNEHADVVLALKRLAGICESQKNFAVASKYQGERLAILRKQLGNDHLDLIAPLKSLAYYAMMLDDYPACRKYYVEALGLERRLPADEQADTASTLSLLGYVSGRLKDSAASKKHYEEALAIRRKVLGNEHEKTAETLSKLGDLAEAAKDYPTAQKYYEETLAIRRKVLGNEHKDTITSVLDMAFVANSQGDVKTAIKYHGEALGLQRKVLGDVDQETALTLGRLGNLSIKIADYSSARKYYEEALAIRRKILGNQHEKTAETLNNLGIVANEQGDYPAAQKFYEEALAINRKGLGRNDANTAAMLNNMGNLALNRKDYPTARKLFDEALVIYRKVLGNQHEDTAQTLNNLGLVANNQGDKLAARKYYEEALAITRKVLGPNHPNTAAILNNMAVLADVQKDYLSARKQYEAALAIKRNTLGNEHPDTADTLYNLATMSCSQKDFLAARIYFDESRRIMRTHVQRTLPGLSESEQVQFLDNVYLKRWTHSLSFGWIQRNDPAIVNSAVSWLINGKAVAQESLAARALLARDATNPQLAQVIKELTAVRQQLSALAHSSAKPGEAGSRQKTLDQLSAEEQRLARVLRQSTGTTAADQGWVELEAIRQTLPPDAIYIDLVRMPIFDFDKQKASPPHYLAWIIPGAKDSRLSVLDLGEAAPLELTIEQARAALAKAADENSQLQKEGEAAATARAAKDLQAVANVVLKPLLPQLANKKQLILSPDGALWLLPWGALPVAENKSLLEECSLRFVLSGRDLVKKETASKLSPGAPAIFVNPDYDLIGTAAKAAIQAILPQATFDETETRSLTSRSSLPRVAALPFTSLEGAAAAPLLKKMTQSEPQTYEQDQALEAVVKNIKRPKHLLLSTHGFFLPDQERKEIDDKLLASSNTRSFPALTKDGQPIENPLLRCGLLFAGCNAPRTPGLDDGILTGLEIVSMDLRGTELVVLSACETGIGKVRNGEGVAGLRQAFQLAGAQSVVSTLWQVPDRDSAIIMQDFFTNLAAGQSKADALRNAQLKRIEARKEKSGAAHPFFWAAWTVTGE